MSPNSTGPSAKENPTKLRNCTYVVSEDLKTVRVRVPDPKDDQKKILVPCKSKAEEEAVLANAREGKEIADIVNKAGKDRPAAARRLRKLADDKLHALAGGGS